MSAHFCLSRNTKKKKLPLAKSSNQLGHSNSLTILSCFLLHSKIIQNIHILAREARRLNPDLHVSLFSKSNLSTSPPILYLNYLLKLSLPPNPHLQRLTQIFSSNLWSTAHYITTDPNISTHSLKTYRLLQPEESKLTTDIHLPLISKSNPSVASLTL